MKKLILKIEFTYDDAVMHGREKDKEAKEWFFKKILGNRKRGGLILFAQDIGDLGNVKLIKVVK